MFAEGRGYKKKEKTMIKKVKNIRLLFVILGIALMLIACSEAENPDTAIDDIAEDSGTPADRITVEPDIVMDHIAEDPGAAMDYIPCDAPIVTNESGDYGDQAPRGVTVISAGEEHKAFEHWHHGFCPEMSVSGVFKEAGDVAEELNTIPIEDDFQIVVEGQILGEITYKIYGLEDDEWVRVLTVYIRDGEEQIFLTHGSFDNRDWEEADAESFLDLLEPGEYILDVGAWWGDSERADAFSNFFRLKK